MLKKVKVENKRVAISVCGADGWQKHVVKHKNFGRRKIWWNGKKGITLHSLSGTTVPKKEATKDIEKLTIDKK